ncbi:hypothetical protein BYT27DRAFT_7077652, partial [Phlegmacium glaucopus]
MNRWILVILLFDFELVHVPGVKHKGPDGLSRRRQGEGEELEGEDEAENWVDEVLGCGIWVAGFGSNGSVVQVLTTGEVRRSDEDVTIEKKGGEEGYEGYLAIQNEETRQKDRELEVTRKFLETLDIPEGLTERIKKAFLKNVSKFFTRGGKLWKKEHKGRHQQVVTTSQEHYRLLIEAHDRLGHKGFYATYRTLADRFWWPLISLDIRWLIKTCHQCQIQSFENVVIPPTVQTPAPLFRKAYIDSMHMPISYGRKYIVQACCSLTGWPEWRALTRETGRTLGTFIFEEILCRWG